MHKSLHHVVIATLLGVVLTGCSSSTPDQFEKVEFRTLASGTQVAEVWITAPAQVKSCRLQGDKTQNVVCIRYSGGRIALPDDVPSASDPSVQVPISVYHLEDPATDIEIDYYKRRFARQE